MKAALIVFAVIALGVVAVDVTSPRAQGALSCPGFTIVNENPTGPWTEESTRFATAKRVIVRDARGDWQGYYVDGKCYPGALVAWNPATQATEDAAHAARVAADAAAATKREQAAGAAVRQKLRDVAAGNGTLTQPQMARLFLHLLNE